METNERPTYIYIPVDSEVKEKLKHVCISR
jgi:hypothetical protein